MVTCDSEVTVCRQDDNQVAKCAFAEPLIATRGHNWQQFGNSIERTWR